MTNSLHFSVSSLPDNPYLKPETDPQEMMPRGRTMSANGEEVYFSDSDDDESSFKQTKNVNQM